MDTAASRASFGPYRLVALIAHSDRASVYRAIDTRHGDRVVALKIFVPALSVDPAFRARFRQDAAALTAVRDPHLVPVHTFGEHAGAVFLDMRFVDAPTLAGRPLPAERSAAVSRQIAQALAAVARSPLGQRSVEPAEVLVTGRDGAEFAQLAGLGLGRVPNGAAAPPATRRRRRLPVAAVLAVVALVVAAAIVIPWSRGRTAPPPGALAVLDDSGDVVAATTAEAGGRSFVSGVSYTGELRAWDLATGARTGPVIKDSGYEPAGVVRDGVPLVLTRDSTQVVHTYRMPDGAEVGRPAGPASPALPGTRRREIEAVVPAEVDGRPAAVLPELAAPAATDILEKSRLGYQVRRLDDGSAGGPLVGFPKLTLQVPPVVATIDDRAVVVAAFDAQSGVLDDQPQWTLRVHDMVSGAEVAPALRLPVATLALRTATRSGAPVALVAGIDNTVRIVDLRTAVPGPALTGMRAPVVRLAVAPAAGRTLIVGVVRAPTQAGGAEIRCWDIETGAPVGPVLRGPVADGYLTTGTVDGRTVIVATEDNGSGADRVVIRELDALLGGT